MTEPRSYWTRVFDKSVELLRQRPELNGDSAYWLARRMVDQELVEQAGHQPMLSDAAKDLKLEP